MKILFCSEEISSISKKIKVRSTIKFINKENLKDIDLSDYDALAGFGLKELDLSGFKWIHSLGAGVDWIINNSSLKQNTIVTRMNVGFGGQIFEYVLSRILMETNNVLGYHENQKKKLWNPLTLKSIHDLEFIILGTGSIGTEIAKGFKLWGCKIYGINSSGRKNNIFDTIYTMNNFPVQRSENLVIINTLPLTSETKNIINKNFLTKIESAILINVGRGQTVNENDLVEALKSGVISSAWLDVFQKEPLPLDSVLWNMTNVHITPHISGPTRIPDLIKCFEKTYKTIVNNEIIDNRVDINREY